MSVELQKLLRELNRKLIPKSVEIEFVKFGDEAFDSLKVLIEQTKSEREASNAICLLFALTKEACIQRRSELGHFLLNYAEDERIYVRSSVIGVLERLYILKNRFPEMQIDLPSSHLISRKVEKAIIMGLIPEDLKENAHALLKEAANHQRN